jgi:hypothetical protein
MVAATEGFVAWLAQADIPETRRTPQLVALLQAVFHFRQQQGSDYYSTRLLSHFLLHCNCGLKVAQIARLVGIARPTASKQQGMSSKAAIQQAHHRMDGRAHGKLLPRYAGAIASFLLGHPKASQAEQINFVAQTFGVQVSRIALYKFLKKYGLHKLSVATQPVEPPSAPAPVGTTVSSLASRPAPLIAAGPITVPDPVIELARTSEPNKPFAPPFSSAERNTPAPSC